MNESKKLLKEMAMEKIARMDKKLEEKENAREWQEQVARANFMGLANGYLPVKFFK
jgi:hypothetical protein